MSELDLFDGGKKCGKCGRTFVVPWPHQYRYKRGELFFCSWHCLRAYDKATEEKDMGRKRLTLEEKKEAVEIAIAGGSPFEYLQKCGSADAYSAWRKIKETLKEADPEKFAQLPKRIGAKKEETEVQEEPEITMPVNYDGFDVMEVKDRDLGRFRWDERGLVYWTHDGDETAMTPEMWRALAERIPRMLNVFGI